MLRKIVNAYTDRFLSRWVVLAFDFVVACFGYLLANQIVSNFNAVGFFLIEAQQQAVFASVAYLIGFVVSGSYSGIIRHTSVEDAYKIIKSTSIALVILLFCSALVFLSGKYELPIYIPRSVLIVHFMVVNFFLIGSRFFIKSIYNRIRLKDHPGKKPILIYGAGSSGLITKQTFEKERDGHFYVVGFIDDNPSKVGKTLEGCAVFSREKALSSDFIQKYNIHQVILSIQKLLPSTRKEIVEKCLELNVKVKVVPPIDRWIQGELSSKQIKAVRIEDLLQREPIRLDSDNIRRELNGKVILISGAAGSIGSEIVRQVLHYTPNKVILLDQAESALYELEMDLKQNLPKLFDLCEVVIGSVSDPLRMRKLFNAFRPQIVFHAAAYKHVPLMENNPYEATKVNILGTKTLADLSIEYGVDKFVMVSTDKAVNPTNVMGASKRVAELYIQSRMGKARVKTQFITTRFGNVLGSNGSVIPLFKKQIEKGGPITITHKDITRYFMTIPEACNLVLEAGAMGHGGEIFVFDMGESVKILDLAHKMIKLSGLEVGKDIEIAFSGLRPGEKLYEELLATKESTKPTHHPKIMIAEVSSHAIEKVESGLNDILTLLNASDDNFILVAAIKRLVPEYVSNNSKFATLDLKKAGNE